MKRIFLAAVLTVIGTSGIAFADPWKDESGRGWRGHNDKWEGMWKRDAWKGEALWWNREEGFWDGRFKHRGYFVPQPQNYYVPPQHYVEPLPPPLW